MKILRIVQASDSIAKYIRKTFEAQEVTTEDIKDLAEFLETKVAKGLEDYETLKTFSLFASLFSVSHKDMAKKKIKPGA